MMNSEQQYIDLYNEASDMLKRHAADALNAVRDRAFADFKAQGFPTRKVERYKYTDIPALFAPDYGLNLNRLEIPLNPYDTFKCDVPNLSTSLYFVVNDSFYNKMLPQAGLPEGVIVDSLEHVATQKPGLIAEYYARIADTREDAITALNTMFAQDGLFVYVPKHVKIDRAIQVINILRADVDLMVNRRVLIVMEQGAEAKFLFCDHAADNRKFLSTQVIEAYVAENASLELNCLEETHLKNTRLSNVYIEQQANSRVNHNVITLHNGVTRNRHGLLAARIANFRISRQSSHQNDFVHTITLSELFCCFLCGLLDSFVSDDQISHNRLENAKACFQLVRRGRILGLELDEVVEAFLHLLDVVSKSLLTPVVDVRHSAVEAGDVALRLLQRSCLLLFLELSVQNKRQFVFVHFALPPFGLRPPVTSGSKDIMSR